MIEIFDKKRGKRFDLPVYINYPVRRYLPDSPPLLCPLLLTGSLNHDIFDREGRCCDLGDALQHCLDQLPYRLA